VKSSANVAPWILASLCVLLSGCRANEAAQRKDFDSSSQTHFQRFVPVSSTPDTDSLWQGILALDTQSGQLCQTHAVPNTSPKWALNLPRCIDLYTNPDKVLALERSSKNLDKEIMDAVKAVKDAKSAPTKK
jgi:hypothetical protein